VNTSQGVVDGVAVKPIKAILPPLGRGIDKVNIAAHDTAQFATTGISQLFEAELLAENIDPQEQTTIWESDPAKADRAIYPYRQPTGMRYLYEAGKDIAAGIVISNVINGGGKDGGINNSGGNEPGRSGGPGTGLGAPGRTGGPGTP
jgi:hypothetical protein